MYRCCSTASVKGLRGQYSIYEHAVHAGLVQDALGERTRTDDPLRLQCALMRLSLPIDLLAAQLLQLPPVDP